MLRMDQVHVIRHKVLVEGLSRRQVAEQLGVSRNTVRKYVSEPEPQRQAERAARRRPVLEKVQGRLEELLAEWSGRTTAKQRLTARRLHQQLVDEGHTVSETTVRGYVRQWKQQQAEVYVPLVHRPGDEAQIDFFEVTVDLAGERVKRWLFLMRLVYSRRDYAWLYERCDQVSFLDGHARAFEHFGGVPARVVYDNLKPAVKRVLVGGRELTPRFMALCSHYLVEPCFTRVGQGHDKGSVEARGKGIRLQHMVPVPEGESLDAMAAALLERLEAQAQR
jgi:transposase